MSVQKQFWKTTCSYRPIFRVITLFTLTLLVLSLVPIWLGGMDSGARVITQINIVLIGVTMIAGGYVLLRCSD